MSAIWLYASEKHGLQPVSELSGTFICGPLG